MDWIVLDIGADFELSQLSQKMGGRGQEPLRPCNKDYLFHERFHSRFLDDSEKLCIFAPSNRELTVNIIAMNQLDYTDYKANLSTEKDENGKLFVISKDGTTTFGRMESDSGLADVPIKLSEGVITNPATKEGYGLVHIEARHGEQIRNAGYTSVVDFVEEVAKNYEIIREGTCRDGNQTYLLQLTDKNNNTLMVELSGDETYWNINTAGVFRTSYGAKNKVVYNRHATEKQSAETAEASLSGELNGTTPSTSMHASIQQNVLSEGKDRKNSDTLQEKQQKTCKD